LSFSEKNRVAFETQSGIPALDIAEDFIGKKPGLRHSVLYLGVLLQFLEAGYTWLLSRFDTQIQFLFGLN
jgi:hypothetical protein